jgi:hypothetical protein
VDCDNWFDMNNINFNVVNGNKDGFNHRCKKCQEIYQHNYYMETREHQIELGTKRYYENVEESSLYHKNMYKNNPDYFKENAKRNVAENPKLYKNIQKRWRKENPERCSYLSSLHRDHDVSTKEYNAMLKVFDYKCAYCGMTVEEHRLKCNEKLHNDHVDEGGYNDLRNDAPACKSCNCSKHEKDMEEWFREQEFFSEKKLEKIKWWITEGYKKFIENKPPYRVTRSRIYEEDGTYTYQFELWTVDEKRNMIKCIAIGDRKKDLKGNIIKHMEELKDANRKIL